MRRAASAMCYRRREMQVSVRRVVPVFSRSTRRGLRATCGSKALVGPRQTDRPGGMMAGSCSCAFSGIQPVRTLSGEGLFSAAVHGAVQRELEDVEIAQAPALRNASV